MWVEPNGFCIALAAGGTEELMGRMLSYVAEHKHFFAPSLGLTETRLLAMIEEARDDTANLFHRPDVELLAESMPYALSGALGRRVFVGLTVSHGGGWKETTPPMVDKALQASQNPPAEVRILFNGTDHYYGYDAGTAGSLSTARPDVAMDQPKESKQDAKQGTPAQGGKGHRDRGKRGDHGRAVQWKGKLDLAKWCSAADLAQQEEIEAQICVYMECVEEWQTHVNESKTPAELCLKTTHPIKTPAVISAAGELSPLADHFMGLMYRPKVTVDNDDSLGNATSTKIILPALRENAQVWMLPTIVIFIEAFIFKYY